MHGNASNSRCVIGMNTIYIIYNNPNSSNVAWFNLSKWFFYLFVNFIMYENLVKMSQIVSLMWQICSLTSFSAFPFPKCGCDALLVFHNVLICKKKRRSIATLGKNIYQFFQVRNSVESHFWGEPSGKAHQKCIKAHFWWNLRFVFFLVKDKSQI